MLSIPPPGRRARVQEVQSGTAVPDPARAEMPVADSGLAKLLPSITTALACSAHHVTDLRALTNRQTLGYQARCKQRASPLSHQGQEPLSHKVINAKSIQHGNW